MELTIDSYDDLIKYLIDNGITMVNPREFQTVLDNFNKICKLEGDVVECGAWRGGFSIFLALLFDDKHIWVSDSFEGFQPLDKVTHQDYNKSERHTPSFTHGAKGPLSISLEEVKGYFDRFGLKDESRIKFLKGFVNETLPTAGIDKISLLELTSMPIQPL